MSDYGRTMSDMQGYLEPEKIKTLISHTRNLRDRTILSLLWATGCRLTELLMLKIEDINVKDQVILMWTLKRKQHRRYQRIVLVNRATIELVNKYLRAYDIKKGNLFSITGRRVQQIVFETGVRANISYVGVKKLHPHHFRHSHGVAWVRANPTMESLRKLQTRMGHASLNTTAHYLQFAFSEQRQEVEKVLGEFII